MYTVQLSLIQLQIRLHYHKLSIFPKKPGVPHCLFAVVYALLKVNQITLSPRNMDDVFQNVVFIME